jgi:hypothetical protein
MGEMADYYLDSVEYWDEGCYEEGLEPDALWYDKVEWHRMKVKQSSKHPLFKDIARNK